MRASASQTDVEIRYVSTTRGACMCCSKPGHHPDKCFFKDQEYRACKKGGHIAKMCLNSRQKNTSGRKKTEKTSHQTANLIQQESDSPESDPEELRFFMICIYSSK